MHTSTFQGRAFVWFLLYLIGFGLGPTIRSQAQGYVAPSPDAMGLARQASSQVSHYTGTLGISIPLAELSGRELSVAVSLNYNTAGNKVADIASSEGLGWSLSAGGLITRVVRGTADDLTNGFCTANKSDTEPDLFIFSFMGRSGKFVLDRNGSPALYPYQDLVIKPGICVNSTQNWEIIDENGTRYIFGDPGFSFSRETTTIQPVAGGAATSYVSSWYLSSVISANGTDEMTFNYNIGTISYTNYFYTKYDGCTNDLALKDESLQVTVSTRQVSSITTSGGSMYFNWGIEREDITYGRALSGIEMRNKQGDLIHTLRFEYAYFQAPGFCSDVTCRRLRLERIFDLSSAPLYSFEYNTAVNLPARNSKNFDHWGYFNNNTADFWLPADPATGLAGASREPDESRLQANILTRMNKRGGHYQRFTYEIHRGIKNGSTQLVGGNRIKSIENGDGQGNVYTISYTYLKTNGEESGILFRKPDYAVYLTSGNTLIVTRRCSHSYAELWDVNGAHIGYSRVEESSTNSGKVVYNFTNYDTNPDPALGGDAPADGPPFAPATSFFWERGNPLSVAVYNQQGQLLTEEKYEYRTDRPNQKQVDGSKLFEIDYRCGNSWGSVTKMATYSIISRPFTLERKTVDVYDQENPSRKVTTITEYDYEWTTYQLASTTEYNAATPTEKYITVNKYTTHADYNYNNSTATDIYQRAVSAMRARHMPSAVIEQQKWIERGSVRTLLGATLNLYKLAGSSAQLVVPAVRMASEKITGTYQTSQINAAGVFVIPASFKNTGSFDTYDNTTGKLLQATSRDGLVAQYTYDHNQTVVKTATVNPGAGAQTTAYEYKPLVGVTKQTDANGQFVSKEYDALGRLRLIKDQDGHIRERYRYHYANETPGFVINTYPQRVLVNETVNFSILDIFVSTGEATQISWNMGNGTVFNDNRQIFGYSYTTAGTYTVTATLTSNEYAPVSRSVTVTVSAPLSATMCVDGPLLIDYCWKQPPSFGSCTVNNTGAWDPTEIGIIVTPGTGCPGSNIQYYWEVRPYSSSSSSPAPSSWYYVGSGSQISYSINGQDAVEIRCTVTDACSSFTISESVGFYRSSTDCR